MCSHTKDFPKKNYHFVNAGQTQRCQNIDQNLALRLP